MAWRIGTQRSDVIEGTDGDDTIFGDLGADTIYGRGGADNLLGEWGADTLYGGAGGDTLHGDLGNDVLYGGNGSDALYGEEGDDVLTGGSGSDTFHFFVSPNANVGVDHITDFSANDTLRISLSEFTDDARGLLASEFFLGSKGDATDELIVYNPDNGALFARSNGDYVKIATIDNLHSVGFSDIVIA